MDTTEYFPWHDVPIFNHPIHLFTIHLMCSDTDHSVNQREQNERGTHGDTHVYTHFWLLRMFGLICNLSLKFILPINIWKIWKDLRLFSKYLSLPFLRLLRSKDNRGWILRMWPLNFATISESLAANLKLRQTSFWQTVPKFWFICLFYRS